MRRSYTHSLMHILACHIIPCACTVSTSNSMQLMSESIPRSRRSLVQFDTVAPFCSEIIKNLTSLSLRLTLASTVCCGQIIISLYHALRQLFFCVVSREVRWMSLFHSYHFSFHFNFRLFLAFLKDLYQFRQSLFADLPRMHPWPPHQGSF